MKMEAADGLALAAAASDEVAPGQPGQQMSAVRISGSAAMPTSASMTQGSRRALAPEVLRFLQWDQTGPYWTNQASCMRGGSMIVY